MTRPIITALAPAMLAATLLITAPDSGSAQSGSASPAELAAIARAHADSGKTRFVPADVDFMSGMIGHHSQAILMAGWAESHGASPSVQVLAKRIINAQQDEITLMNAWLRNRHQPIPEPTGGHGMKMKMNGMEHVMLMPGMLTDDQLAQLDAARGPDFDRLFLTFMMQHHRGATSMVRELFATDGAAQDEQVFKFASDVNVDQTTEIARMQRMLDALMGMGNAP